MRRSSLPVEASHTLAVPSLQAPASRLPSGLNITEEISTLPGLRVRTAWAESGLGGGPSAERITSLPPRAMNTRGAKAASRFRFAAMSHLLAGEQELAGGMPNLLLA